MRSEKETEDLLNMKSGAIIDSLKDLNIAEKYRVIASLFYSLKDVIKSEGGTVYEGGLEGEPRYSVAELEKLCDYWGSDKELNLDTEEYTDVKEVFLKLLKDKKRVEAILSEDNKVRKV